MNQQFHPNFDFEHLRLFFHQLYETTGVSVALMDADGELLVQGDDSGFCSAYLAAHADTATCCKQDQQQLVRNFSACLQSFRSVCPFGLHNAVTPLVVEGCCLGGLLFGKVFLEPPDQEYYRQLAGQHGFDQQAFLTALQQVPLITEERFDGIVRLVTSVAHMLAAQEVDRCRTARHNQCQESLLRLYAQPVVSLNELLDKALVELLALSGSNIGHISGYDEATGMVSMYSCTVSAPEISELSSVPQVFELDNIGLWGEAVRQRRGIICNEYAADIPDHAGEADAVLRRYMSLPVFYSGRIVALAGVGNKLGRYTSEDLRQAQLLLDACWTRFERIRSLDEVREARLLAEEALKLKTNLLNNISHELRTPLNGILGGAQLLAFTSLTSEQHEYLDMIEVSAANELSLVNNLLELVKMETEGVTIARERFQLHETIKELIRLYGTAARDKGLELTFELLSGVPEYVRGDVVRIRQIAACLLGNAIKFTARGGITVRLAGLPQQGQYGLVRLTISDTGIGICPEQQEIVFELMSQADTTNTRSYGGLGLGLAISSRLAKELGGRILLESTPGVGSVFTLELPLESAAAAEPAETAYDGGGGLLVEDDPLSAHATAALVRKLGYRVVVATSADEALHAFRQEAFALVLLDIQMPVMSGFEVLQQFRQLEQQLGRPCTPVIAQTAYIRSNHHESFIGAGFDGFLAKPLLREELKATIERWSRMRPGRCLSEKDEKQRKSG